MKFYFEIQLITSSEISEYFLWSKLYQQVHLALASTKDQNNLVPIGVAFPEYCDQEHQLGRILRLFANEESTLRDLNLVSRLQNFAQDYLNITSIRNVPSNISTFAVYQRKQSKSSIERIVRRKAKRDGTSEEEAKKKMAENYKSQNNYNPRLIKDPFINMISLSSQQRFRLFIYKSIVSEPKDEGFNCYGLSQISTVPEF